MTSDAPPKLINGQNFFGVNNDCCGKVLLENQPPTRRMLLSTARDLAQVPTMCLSLALRCAFLRHSSVLGRKKRKFHVHGMPNTLEPGDFVFCPKCPCVNAARSATAAASAGVAPATVTLALRSTIAVRGYVKGSWLHRGRGRQLQVPAMLDSSGARLARVSPVRTRSSPQF